MAVMGGVRARIVVGSWKNGVAKKYIFCLSRRSGARASERNEHDKSGNVLCLRDWNENDIRSDSVFG